MSDSLRKTIPMLPPSFLSRLVFVSNAPLSKAFSTTYLAPCGILTRKHSTVSSTIFAKILVKFEPQMRTCFQTSDLSLERSKKRKKYIVPHQLPCSKHLLQRNQKRR